MPRNTAGTLNFALSRSSRPILVPSFQSWKTVHEKSARVTKYKLGQMYLIVSCIVSSSVDHL